MRWRHCLLAWAIVFVAASPLWANDIDDDNDDQTDCESAFIFLYGYCETLLKDYMGNPIDRDDAIDWCKDEIEKYECVLNCYLEEYYFTGECEPYIECVRNDCDWLTGENSDENFTEGDDDDDDSGCSAYGGSTALPLTVFMLLIGAAFAVAGRARE